MCLVSELFVRFLLDHLCNLVEMVDDSVGDEVFAAFVVLSEAQGAFVACEQAGAATGLGRGPHIVEHVVADIEGFAEVDFFFQALE